MYVVYGARMLGCESKRFHASLVCLAQVEGSLASGQVDWTAVKRTQFRLNAIRLW